MILYIAMSNDTVGMALYKNNIIITSIIIKVDKTHWQRFK